MGSQEQAFQQRADQVAVREFRFRNDRIPVRNTHPMFVASPLQAGGALSPVRVDRAARFHAVPDKLAQAACCGIREVAQANPSHRTPVQLHGNHHQGLQASQWH